MGETAPKPMRADARRNYDRLLNEARTAFAERGIESSLEDVARHAGCRDRHALPALPDP